MIGYNTVQIVIQNDCYLLFMITNKEEQKACTHYHGGTQRAFKSLQFGHFCL